MPPNPPKPPKRKKDRQPLSTTPAGANTMQPSASNLIECTEINASHCKCNSHEKNQCIFTKIVYSTIDYDSLQYLNSVYSKWIACCCGYSHLKNCSVSVCFDKDVK